MIAEGCIPFPWAEGGYNSRLKVIKDVPKGKVIWGFDTTDMAEAKKILGDVACIGGQHVHRHFKRRHPNRMSKMP